jgi:hypothetical protein
MALAIGLAQAQSPASTTSDPDSSASPADAPPEGKKKGGLFGKVKGLAGNKTVQAVAKTAACTVVPGGQVIAGAIDAASSENVGEAAAGAAGAAGGQTCMPGGIGGMGMDAGAAAAGSMPGLGGVGSAVGSAGALGTPGLPAGAMGYGAMGYGAMGDAESSDQLAACMGLSPEEFQAFTDPTGGEQRPATKEEMKRQQQLAGKIDMARYQACVMQQYSAGMTPAGGPMVPSRDAPAEEAPEDAPADGRLTESPGKRPALAADPAAQLGKGKTTVKDIDWLTGGGDVSAEGRAAFAEGMATLAAAITRAGGTYRADIYLDKRYQDAALNVLGSARLTTVVAALEAAGVAADVVAPGKVKKDKNPRLEIVRVNP